MGTVRVVVAEDEQLTRELLVEQLKQLNHIVVGEATTGAEAVQVTVEKEPDLVILDIQMPEMTGIEAAKSIMESRPTALLFLTGHAEEELVEQAVELGAFGYLLKPFRKQELGPAIEVAIKRFGEFRSKDREVSDLKEALETRKLIERAKGILMERQNISEAEAFRRIHFMARNQNKTMKEVAQSVIMAADIL
ncbi:MAG: response regulator [Armatimonadetes bacterium]|nr:response regulator [Armatimonadota bacterium]